MPPRPEAFCGKIHRFGVSDRRDRHGSERRRHRRIGLAQPSWPLKAGLFAAGAALLFGYGLAVNLAPLEFGRVVGLYIATLFVVWQIVNFVTFRAAPTLPILVGGAFIVLAA